MARQRAYLLPDVLCPSEKMGICIQIPDNLGHLLAFLAQIEHLANWYAWEKNETRDNVTVADCWREVFNDIRAKIDDNIRCSDVASLQEIRLVDCLLEKQDEFGIWSEVGSIADCVSAGIADALADGTIPPSPYPDFPEPETNPVNPTADDVACGIADFMSDYLIEKFNDNLDLIEAGVNAGVATAKIAADVVDAIAGWAPIVGGIIAGVKDVIEGSVAVTFATIRASDTVDWRSNVKCDLYNRLRDNGGKIGTALSPVITGWIEDIKAYTEAISPLFGRWLEGIDLKGFLKWQKIAEDNEGECDDCLINFCYDFDFTTSDGGWLPDLNTDYAAWSNGNGWGEGAQGAVIHITKTVPNSAIITVKKITVWVTGCDGQAYDPDFNFFIAYVNGAPAELLGSDPQQMNCGATRPFVGTTRRDGVTSIQIHSGYHPAASMYISAVRIEGQAEVNPFGTDNCT
ncbi:MAG: hypothetical protein IT564_11635 [Rhodospirillales bacterium]|nr:hypothetical protein [Rhodospirillales bacterium]